MPAGTLVLLGGANGLKMWQEALCIKELYGYSAACLNSRVVTVAAGGGFTSAVGTSCGARAHSLCSPLQRAADGPCVCRLVHPRPAAAAEGRARLSLFVRLTNAPNLAFFPRPICRQAWWCVLHWQARLTSCTTLAFLALGQCHLLPSTTPAVVVAAVAATL